MELVRNEAKNAEFEKRARELVAQMTLEEKAFQMIVTGECGVFSPKLLDCFWNARRAFERLADG